MSQSNTTLDDVLEAINSFADHTEERFYNLSNEIVGIKKDVGSLKQDVGSLKQDVGSLKQDVGSLKLKVGSIQAQMVTKSYLDDKLADLRGDLISNDRKQDKKIDFLTRTLESKKVLTAKEADAIISLSPFPRPPKI